jgi:hypothetical protein
MKHNTSARSRAVSLFWLQSLFVLAAAGCGGGSDDTPATPASAPAPAPALPAIAAAVNLDDNHQVGTLFFPDGDTATGGQGATVMGVPCGPVDQTFHIHSHVSIFMNGQALAIPANIGRGGALTCTYSIHTHDHSGKIHMEGPAPTTFTLGQLFGIWGMPLTTTNVAGIVNLPLTVYITENATVTAFTGDPATIPMLSHRHIALVLGTPITEVPFFTWTAN